MLALILTCLQDREPEVQRIADDLYLLTVRVDVVDEESHDAGPGAVVVRTRKTRIRVGDRDLPLDDRPRFEEGLSVSVRVTDEKVTLDDHDGVLLIIVWKEGIDVRVVPRAGSSTCAVPARASGKLDVYAVDRAAGRMRHVSHALPAAAGEEGWRWRPNPFEEDLKAVDLSFGPAYFWSSSWKSELSDRGPFAGIELEVEQNDVEVRAFGFFAELNLNAIQIRLSYFFAEWDEGDFDAETVQTVSAGGRDEILRTDVGGRTETEGRWSLLALDVAHAFVDYRGETFVFELKLGPVLGFSWEKLEKVLVKGSDADVSDSASAFFAGAILRVRAGLRFGESAGLMLSLDLAGTSAGFGGLADLGFTYSF